MIKAIAPKMEPAQLPMAPIIDKRRDSASKSTTVFTPFKITAILYIRSQMIAAETIRLIMIISLLFFKRDHLIDYKSITP